MNRFEDIPGDQRFYELLEEMAQLHSKKQADYGRVADPLHNLRAASEFGLPADLGVALRLNDKMNRVKTFYSKGQLVNDSVEDDYLDMAIYALHAIILRRERQQRPVSDGVCNLCGELAFKGHFDKHENGAVGVNPLLP